MPNTRRRYHLIAFSISGSAWNNTSSYGYDTIAELEENFQNDWKKIITAYSAIDMDTARWYVLDTEKEIFVNPIRAEASFENLLLTSAPSEQAENIDEPSPDDYSPRPAPLDDEIPF